MEHNARQEAERILDRLEVRYGYDSDMRRRLLPIIVRILESSPPSSGRRTLLSLVLEAYEHHVKVRDTIDLLRLRLRERLNEVYGEVLGIEPPGIREAG